MGTWRINSIFFIRKKEIIIALAPAVESVRHDLKKISFFFADVKIVIEFYLTKRTPLEQGWIWVNLRSWCERIHPNFPPISRHHHHLPNLSKFVMLNNFSFIHTLCTFYIDDGPLGGVIEFRSFYSCLACEQIACMFALIMNTPVDARNYCFPFAGGQRRGKIINYGNRGKNYQSGGGSGVERTAPSWEKLMLQTHWVSFVMFSCRMLDKKVFNFRPISNSTILPFRRALSRPATARCHGSNLMCARMFMNFYQLTLNEAQGAVCAESVHPPSLTQRTCAIIKWRDFLTTWKSFPCKSLYLSANFIMWEAELFPLCFKITCTCCCLPRRFPIVIINSFKNVYVVFKTSTWCCCSMAGVFPIISVKMKCERSERKKFYII